MTDSIALHVAEKCTAILNKYSGWERDVKEYFKMANITVLDVERAFFKYKHIFSPHLRSLNELSMESALMLRLQDNFVQCYGTSSVFTLQ